jgi:uncharacterized protein (TIGR03084 family)
MSPLETVLADLAVEGDRLEALVAPLGADGWRAPTPAQGWTVAHQVAHLAWTDEAAVAAATDPAAWDLLVQQALEDPDGFVDAEAARGAATAGPELLTRWRSSRTALPRALTDLPEGRKLPWFGPPMGATSMATARFMETWAHGRDVAAALGVTMPREDSVRHVVHIGVRARGFAFANHALPAPADDIRVSLVLPSGAVVEHGSADAAQTVRGPAYDFALLVTQRAHRDDLDLVASGPDAEQWLDIAQAFAGPSGGGRPPVGKP